MPASIDSPAVLSSSSESPLPGFTVPLTPLIPAPSTPKVASAKKPIVASVATSFNTSSSIVSFGSCIDCSKAGLPITVLKKSFIVTI